jgi:hypothetical protein
MWAAFTEDVADLRFVGLWFRADVSLSTRRFLDCVSTSPSAARSIAEPLFVPDFEDKEVLDLFPRLLKRALNFRFEAFIAVDSRI